MATWTTAFVSAFLLVCAIALIFSHIRAWRRVREQDCPPKELDYHRRQFRRRMQTSVMLGLLAVALFVGQLLTGPPLFMVLFWAALLLLIVWMGLLAAADIMATRQHFGRLRHEHLLEQAKLQAELRRIQSARSNGKAKHKKPRPK